MTDASSTATTDDGPGRSPADDGPGRPPADDGPGRSPADDGPERSPTDDRPDRPPTARLVDALGVARHAKRGLAVGVVLAVAVFAFFVVVPAVDPGTPTRTESPVLYLALAFVVATTGMLLVASALAVRAVTGRVMDYAKWTRRASVVGSLGGVWMAATGLFAMGVTSGYLPVSVRPVVLATLPLPVLLLAVGAWSALARTGGGRTPGDEHVASDGFDHVLARARLANAGAVVALAGVVAVHVATFLETNAFLATTAPGLGSAVVLGTVALAAGTVALATALVRRVDLGALATAAGALAAVGAGIVLTAAVTGTAALVPLGALGALGLAWTALTVTIRRHPGTYPERPV